MSLGIYPVFEVITDLEELVRVLELAQTQGIRFRLEMS
jgi:hypothetical protein